MSISTNFLIEDVTLQERILKTVGDVDPLFTALSEVKSVLPNDPLIKELTFPEYLLRGSKILDSYSFDELKPRDTLFHGITGLIGRVGKSYYGESVKTQLNAIVKIYQDYIQNVCQTRGKERKKLLKGSCRIYGILHGKLECRNLTQKWGRYLTCLGKYNETIRPNPYGANAVRKEKNVFYKRSLTNPLSPGMEYAVDSLNKLISGGGSPPTELLKITNIVTLDPFAISKGSDLRRYLVQQQCNRRLIADIFENDGIKDKYPFKQLRNEHILQASNAVEGINLHEFLKDPKPLDDYGYTSMFFLSVIYSPLDGRADNYIATAKLDGTYCILGIDNDNAFELPFNKVKTGHFVNLKTVLFCLPEMDNVLNEQFVNYFLTIDPAILLIDWMAELERRNASYQDLLDRQVFSLRDYEELSLPIHISFPFLSYMYHIMNKLQNFLRENNNVTHWDVLYHVLPCLYHVYKAIIAQATNDPMKAQEIVFDFRGVLLEDILAPEIIQEIPDFYISPKPNDSNNVLQEFFLFVLPSLDQLHQYDFLKHAFCAFLKLPSLILKNLHIDDVSFIRLISYCRSLQELTLDKCDQITKVGIIRLLNDNAQLHLVLGFCDKISPDDLASIINFALGQNRTFSVCIENQSYLMEKEKFNKLFYIALSSSYFTLAKALILLGVDPNFVSNTHKTCFHLLSEKGSIQAFNFLIENGGNIEIKDRMRRTPMHLAAYFGNLDAVRFFIENKSAVNALNVRGMTALHLAVLSNHADIVKLLIDEGADPYIVISNNETVMHIAASEGCLQALEELLKHESWSLIEKEDDKGETPLHKATQGNPKFEIVDLLINKGANPNAKNEFGYTPLHWAAKFGHLESLKKLVITGDINAKGEYDRTLLHMSVYNRQISVTEFLIQQGLDINAQLTTEDCCKTVLHYAVTLESEEMTTLLTKSPNLNVNVCDIRGYSPLWHAVADNSERIVKLLVYHESFKNPLNCQNPNHLNKLIELARFNGSLEIFKTLKIFELNKKVQECETLYLQQQGLQINNYPSVEQKQNEQAEKEIEEYRECLLKDLRKEIDSFEKNLKPINRRSK